MATIIGGAGTGLWDSSLYLLNRRDVTGKGEPGHGEELYINISNGDLVLRHQDAYLPSKGEDFNLVRTYNSRGQFNTDVGKGWTLSVFLDLDQITNNKIILVNPDSSQYTFNFESSLGAYRSVDGPGAYETIVFDSASRTYILTRADQTKLTFDRNGTLLKSEDPNGNRMVFRYDHGNLSSIEDDDGHVIRYHYDNGNLTRVTDESESILVRYTYDGGNRLASVIDREGHETRYHYTNDGTLAHIHLPDGEHHEDNDHTEVRTIRFEYDTQSLGSGNERLVLRALTDAEGNRTEFDYSFTLVQNKYQGGSTRMLNALGVNRMRSNDDEYVDWRRANGYYSFWSEDRYEQDSAFRAQANAIRDSHTTVYTFDKNGAVLSVTEPRGFAARYEYDALENLTAIIDPTADAVTRSDDPYFRGLRKDLGFTNTLTGQGKLVAELTASDISALKERYTTRLNYDARGNLLSRRDGEGNLAIHTYTAFNKLASQTAAMGNALVTSDSTFNRDKRKELGYIDASTGQGKTVAQLTAGEKQALLELYTTRYTYDAKQNLTEIKNPGGDLIRFAYDSVGNLVKRTVFLDAADLIDPSKQQVTQYFYDVFGNNVKTTDAEGASTFASFDHFGNRTTVTDALGGVTRFFYDDDNRLISVTDPEGHTTVNAYDAVGNRISTRDANGHTVTYVYDRNNLLITVINPISGSGDRITRSTFDVVGNRTTVTDAEGHTTTYTYREDNRLVTVTTPTVTNALGQSVRYTTTYAYDAEGNRIKITDNNGNITQHVFNANSLITQTTDAVGQVTQYSYDANLNRISVLIGAQLAPAKRQLLRFGYDEEDQLIRQTDALGNTTTTAYDAPGNRVSITDALGRTTDYSYDRNNRLLKETKPAVTDPNTGLPVRYTIQHQYDANGNEIATTDENGHTTRFSFDADSRLVMIEDANGIKTVHTYDSRNNRTAIQIGVQAHMNSQRHVVVDSVQDAQVTTYTYDEFNQLVSKTDAVGNALTTSDNPLYRNMRRDLGITDRNGNGETVAQLNSSERQFLRNAFTEHYSYDRVGNLTSTTDHLDRTTEFTYDALNRRSRRTDELGGTTRFAYDGNGNRVKDTDALGRVNTYAYDAANRLINTTDALDVTTHREYDSFGNLTAQTAAAGTPETRTTRYVYDLNNRLLQQTDAEGHTQAYEYDAVGNRLKLIDGRGNATNYVYDALNRNVKIIDPLHFETKIEFDGVGNQIRLIDANGGVKRLTYDAGNRYIETQDGEGRITRFTYDVRGNRITQTTAAGTADAETTVFEYDAENHLRSVTDAEGHITTQDYDRVYNRVETVDGNGNATRYEFDALNRVIEVTNAEGGRTTYTYDAVGNRLSVTDANGHRIVESDEAYYLALRQQLGFVDSSGNALLASRLRFSQRAQLRELFTTHYEYDARNQLIRQIDHHDVVTSYAYDKVGNRVAITQAAGTALAATTTFVYNRDDQLIAQTDALGHTTTFAYDANHNRTQVTDPLGHTTTYIYDADNRVHQIVDPVGNTVEYRYDGNGNRVQVIDGRGSISTAYYNADNEVVLAVDAEGFATSFSYDHNGNVIAQTLYANALTLPLDPAIRPTPAGDAADRVTRFGYDKVNRLVQRLDGEGFITQYVYDAVGNRTQTRQALDRAGTQFAIRHSYYDDINREILSLSAEGYLVENRYDAVGNRITHIQYDQRVVAPVDGLPAPAAGDAGRSVSFVYDRNNRLIRQTSPRGVVATFEYDARGNRTAMTEAAGTPEARTTLYRYDAADRYIETVNAAGVATHMELDADGNVLTRREAFGTAQERVYRFEYDGNHRVVRQTDALGVVSLTGYDAAGNIVSRTVAAGLPEARTEAFVYDRNNRQIASVNGEGDRTEYAYNAAGNRIRLTQAPGLPEERSNLFVYDRDNRLAQVIDGVGSVTEYHYDGAGNKIETVQAKGGLEERHTFYAYDQDNRLVQVTDPMGGVTRYEYDVLGNQTRIIDANGGVQQNTFDIIGRVVSSLSAGGILTQNTYDLRNNILATTQSWADHSDARTVTYAYDILNRQVLVTDGEGFSTSIVYDAFGSQTQIIHGQYLVPATDPAYDTVKAGRAFPQTNGFSYDGAGRMSSMTDAEGNIIQFAYDAVGNRISVTEAANSAPRTTHYSYDRANRLIETLTPEGGISRNVYDGVGNKVAEDLLQSGDPASGMWIHRQFEYDRNGRLAAEIDPFAARTEYRYDAVGNLISRRTAAGTADQREMRMEYDFNNRKITDIDGEGNRTSYVYDSLGNRIKLTDALGRVAHYYYNAANQLVEIVDPEGFINTFVFDAAGNRLEERVYMTRHSGAIDDRVPPPPVSSALDRITTHQYDRTNREIARSAPDGAQAEFIYDGVGNKLQERLYTNTPTPHVMHYVYDRDNRLVQFTDIDGTITAFTYDGANNRLSEIVSNASDTNSVRATHYTYDLNNRRIRQVFDPAGLNIVQLTAYDKLGNVVANTDGNGHTTTLAYDLNNRLVEKTDALGNTTHFGYDAVGNQTAVTDARGNTTNFVYDGNNRVVQEIRPQVEVFTISGGHQILRPTFVKQYDAAGNEVQAVDASGFIVTRYYDGNNRMVAELNGEHVLREYSYNATGDQLTETLYMTRLTLADHNPALRPTPPAGEARVITRTYDLAGRLTRTVYPAITVTTLIDTDTNHPTPVTMVQQLEERKVYDAFGNEIESFDRQGNRAVSYYDIKGRKLAMVDALGFLVEWDYDSQDNQIEQRLYTQPLDPASVSASIRPTPPAGEVFVTSMRYDAASRRIEEQAPQIEVFDPVTQTSSFVRSRTTYTYDQAGNQLTKTLAAGTAQAITEYSFYDGADRRIAVISSGRVLHLYQYDAQGNITERRRFFATVPGGVDLSQLHAGSDFASLTAGIASRDQITRFAYDALNRTSEEADLMFGAADLVKRYRYDAVNNRSFRQDEDGFVTQTSYDSVNRVLQTVNADGNGTLAEYDAAGNQVFVFTGKMANAALPATNIRARLGDGLTLTWDMTGTGQQSWVVYDSVSHENLAEYASRTATQFSFTGTAQARLGSSVAGSTVFFRVVTQDGAGNRTWTAEQTLTVPSRFSDVAVTQPTPTTLVVTARFGAGTQNPRVLYGEPGNLNQSATFMLQADGSYKATLNTSDPQALSYKFVWQDAALNNYSSAESHFEARADQVGIFSNVSQGTVTNGMTTQFKIHVNTKVPSTYAAGLTAVQAQWRLAGSNAAFAATAITGVDAGLGLTSFALVLGDDTPLNAGDYEIVLSGVSEDGSSVLLDTFSFTVGVGASSSIQQSISWVTPPAGDDQLVIINDEVARSNRRDGRVLVDYPVDDSGTVPYQVFYSQRETHSHTVKLISTAVPGAFNLSVEALLDADELANIDGELHLAWHRVGSDDDFTDVIFPSTGTHPYQITLGSIAAGKYDLKIYYTDAQGRDVIVDWLRADTAVPSRNVTGFSHIVLAQETDGKISLDERGLFTIDPGLYTGPIDTNTLLAALTLDITPTGNPGGSQDADGRSTGYFTETVYNALNHKIAANENDGLWREFGVDAGGHAVETRLYGEKGASSFIASYTAYDARGRKTAEYSAPVAAAGGGLERPVRRYAYNVFDKVTQDTDALGHTRLFEYNALNTLVRETDPNGSVKITRVDIFGRETAMVSELGHTTLKFYDLQGRLVKERDALGNETGYRYDNFDRKIAQTNGLGMATADPDDHTIRYDYDQRDRMVRLEQPQGWHLAHDDAAVYQDERERLGYARDTASLSDGDRQALVSHYSVNYAYDGRNNRTSTFYPLGQRTDEVYDAVGRVVDTQVYLSGSPTHNQRAYDVYGNLFAETDGEGRVKTKIFGGFGRLLQEFDEDGNQVAYDYDIYGRILREFDPNGGKDVRKTYDDAGRMLTLQDLGTGVSTAYNYDFLGRRLTEVTTGNGHDRNLTYQYDALGQLVRWADSVTGLHLNTLFDAEGNRVRAYTDFGFDPLGQNGSANPNFRYIDHIYTFDGSRRVLQEAQRSTDAAGNSSDALISSFGYDAASNRIAWNNQGTAVSYIYDANSRVVQGDWEAGGSSNRQAWTYDAMGNVLSFLTFQNGGQTSSTVNQYNDANRTTTTSKDGQTTTRSYDRSLRITQTILRQSGKTYYYNHSYFGDGRERSINAFGDAFGNSTSQYDTNKVRIRVDLGQGDSQNRPEFKTFVADNEGHLVFQFHDDGKSGTMEEREYLYAVGNPVGERGHGTDGVNQVLLDTGAYNPINNLGNDFPGGVLTYTTRENDTLQSIAGQMYGNPSLWFVIADANGINPNESIKAGTQLTVPNSVKTGHITSENHKIYSESEIVGSTLPNLKTPPPPKPKKGCGSIIMIIIIVVIAVVAAFFVGPLATAILNFAVAGGAAAAGAIATVAAYAVAGAVIGAVASIVQQGLFIALGYQEKFSWKDVGASAVAGAFSGAAQGIGAAAQAGKIAADSIQYAKVASGALQAASVASKQLILNGKITSWTSLAAAAVSGYMSTDVSAAQETLKVAEKGSDAFNAAQSVISLQNTINYLTPWVQLAETYVRNDGKLTPMDWASAVGSTLSQAVVNNFGVKGDEAGKFAGQLQNASLRLGANLLVAGALRHYDKEAAQSYFENAVGQEAGQLIGDNLVQYLSESMRAKPLVVVGDRDDEEEQVDFDPQEEQLDDYDNPVGPEEVAPPAAPAAEDANVTQEPFTTTTVKKGQSLGQIIAHKYGKYDPDLVLKIAAYNGIEDPHLIQIGQDIILPDLDSGLLDNVQLNPTLLANYEEGLKPAEIVATPDEQASTPVADAPVDDVKSEVAAPPGADSTQVQQSNRTAEVLDKFKEEFKKGGLAALKTIGKALDALEIEELVQIKEGIKSYLDEQGAKVVAEGGVFADVKLAGLALIYAAVEVAFPTNVLDFIPGGKGATAGRKAAGKLDDVLKHVDDLHLNKLDDAKIVSKADDIAGAAAATSKTEKEVAQVVQNKRAGTARENLVQKELELANPGASVQREQYLRDASGNIVKDVSTGEARRIDHIVIENGRVIDVVETTSLTADKAAQIAKEGRIRDAGGTFIRDRVTGKLVDLSKVPTREVRKP